MRQPRLRPALWGLAFGFVVGSALLLHGGGFSRQTPAAPKAPATAGGQASLAVAEAKYTGDLDEMLKRRRIRILTPYSKTHYFIDKGVQRGIVYDTGIQLEAQINRQMKTTPATHIHVVFVPTSRDALLQSLQEGRGDLVMGGIIATPERAKIVDFSVPVRTDVNHVLVAGPGAPKYSTIEDLAGQQVACRDKSIQFEYLTALNEVFKKADRPPVVIRTVPASLEDEDILEMVSSGLLKATVVDSLVADFWKQLLPDVTVYPTIAVARGGTSAIAVRKSSPKILGLLNPFINANKMGTVFGNTVIQKYWKSTKYVKNATNEAELAKFRGLVDIFKKYGGTYDLDYVLMLAQGFQESRLDQKAKSHVGAVGVMQVMPATGKDLKVGDINQVDANIHAGVKYIRFMIDQYYAKEPMDPTNRMLFAFAAYNAGPGRIRQLRREAQTRGLDPNVWFNNVERIVGERIGRETCQYVSNIFKYYVAYTLTLEDWAAAGGRKGGPVRLEVEGR